MKSAFLFVLNDTRPGKIRKPYTVPKNDIILYKGPESFKSEQLTLSSNFAYLEISLKEVELPQGTLFFLSPARASITHSS